MPVGDKTLMDGTTLCHHCNTRFKITETQLQAHNGMVRCGQCLQIFDARPNFVPDQPNPQLELPILSEPPAPITPVEIGESSELNFLYPTPPSSAQDVQPEMPDATEPSPPEEPTVPVDDRIAPGELPQDGGEDQAELPEAAHDELADLDQSVTAPAETGLLPESESPDAPEIAAKPEISATPEGDAPSSPQVESAIVPLTLAEQVAVVHNEEIEDAGGIALKPKRRRWPWAIASLLLLLLMLAQSTYFFRIQLAAHLPGLKPVLVNACKMLDCSIPLPQLTDLISIESSELEADPAHENRITLNALLRNRAAYTQAFPSLELTLNDLNDKPLARRIFRPADYLPPPKNEAAGLQPGYELAIKLSLDVTDLRPTGYRLALFYPQ